MSHKKLFWKYNNMESKENMNFDADIMEKVKIFQMLLKMTAEQAVPVPTINRVPMKNPEQFNKTASTPYNGINSNKASYVGYANENSTECGVLNLVKPKSLDPTVLRSKRPATNDLLQPTMKAPRFMLETELKTIVNEPITAPQCESTYFPCVQAVYEEPRHQGCNAEAQQFPTRLHTNRLKSTKKRIYPMTEYIQKCIENNAIKENDEELVVLGPNGTKIKRDTLHEIDWCSTGAKITRKLLTCIFDDSILATHSLSGKKSPAFLEFDMPAKGQLDPCIIADIIYFMKLTKNSSKQEVKMAVTTKCADASKKYRAVIAQQ